MRHLVNLVVDAHYAIAVYYVRVIATRDEVEFPAYVEETRVVTDAAEIKALIEEYGTCH